MKNFKKILAAVLSAAMVVTLAPVGAATTVEAAATTAIKGTTMKLSASKATLNVGKSKTIKITLSKKQTKNAVKVTVKSSKASVAKVNKSSVSVKKNAKTASFKITAKKAGSATVTVTCKTKAKKTLKKTVKVTVKAVETNEDNVDVTDGKITLVDAWGLQEGTTNGLVGDTLRLTIPAELGTMTSIVWYRDGGQIATSSANGDSAQLTGAGANANTSVPGEYYAVAITAKGTTYKSNSITLVEGEAAAKILSFSITDDYTNDANVVYDAKDNKAVVTVVLNKDYKGKFRLYRKVDTKYTTIVNGAAGEVYNNSTDAGTFTSPATTDEQAATGGAGVLYKYRDLKDGKVTYKFLDTVTRGEEYVVTFDQDSVANDTPSSGKANVFETAATAPYVTKPAKITVSKVSNGNKPEVTFYDENGAVLGWLGGVAGKATTAAGFDEAIIYKSESKTTTTTATGVSQSEKNTGTVAKGVWTGATNADNTAFWFATVKTTKGVYGAASETLTSEAVQTAQAAATQISILQNAKTPTTATVSFQNLRAAGKLYMISSKGIKSVTTVGRTTTVTKATSEVEALTYEYGKFDPEDKNTYDSVTDVEVGALTVDVANAIHPVALADATGTDGDDRYSNAYIAIFIPTDEVNYGKIATLAKGTGAAADFTVMATNSNAPTAGGNFGVVVEQALKSYALNGNFASKMGAATAAAMYVHTDNTISGTADTTDATAARALTELDQFGVAMNQAATKTWKFTSANGENNITGTVQLVWDNDAGHTLKDSTIEQGSITLSLGTGTPVNGEKWTCATSTGQTFTLSYTTAAGWSLTLS